MAKWKLFCKEIELLPGEWECGCGRVHQESQASGDERCPCGSPMFPMDWHRMGPKLFKGTHCPHCGRKAAGG